jgi:hypothetical protein
LLNNNIISIAGAVTRKPCANPVNSTKTIAYTTVDEI